MRCTILVLSLAIFYATASMDDVVPEDTNYALDTDLSEAQSTVNEMIAAGKSDKDCRKLVDDTRKGVTTNVANCQKIMDALPRGDHCTNLGQGAVKKATEEKSKADKHVITCSTNVKKTASASVAFGSRTFSSLTEGKCSEFYSSATFTTAEANYNAAVTAHTKAKGAAGAAATALKEAIAAAAKAKSECLCKTRTDHETLFATHSASAKADQDAWTFANKVECVLDGKAFGNCPAVTAPKCKRPTLTSAVMAENCKKCNGKETLNFVNAAQTGTMSGHNPVQFGPKQAIDNNSGTRNGMLGPGAWTGDFGKPVDLRSLKVDWEACQCNNAKSVAVSTSTDGKTWKTCGYWGGFHQWGRSGKRTHDVEKHGCAGMARYVRYTTTSNMGASQWMSMWSASAEGCK